MAEDNGYSEAQRMKFAGHINPRTFLKSYMPSVSAVDGQSSFLAQPLRKDHIEDFRGMSLYRHPQLWQSLPAKMQYDFERREDFMACQREIESLNAATRTTMAEEDRQRDRLRRQELYEQKRQLTIGELKKWRKMQPRNLVRQTGTEPVLEDHHRTFFAQVRHLVPKRYRLATTLFLPVGLRSVQGQEALRDLITLCSQPTTVVYQRSLQPGLDGCPPPCCTVEINRSVISLS